ncbi:MAG: zf-HC2 domain-containing protein [Acidobacteria bacterium]|nr:zf-HC2 domain-containing protein [Acidobacteriota bacterium]
MTCFTARQNLAAFLDEELAAEQSDTVRSHLLVCDDCHEQYEYKARLSSPLRELPAVEPPVDLSTAIRLRLSDEQRPSFWERWQVHLANLMRPVALPAAGGVLTALILFGVLMPAVSFTRFTGSYDVPTGLSTDPRFKQASMLPVYDDLLVEAWIDEQGKVSSYQVLNASTSDGTSQKNMDYQLGDVLLTTIFEPATYFGQRTSGKVLLSLRRINIRG